MRLSLKKAPLETALSCVAHAQVCQVPKRRTTSAHFTEVGRVILSLFALSQPSGCLRHTSGHRRHTSGCRRHTSGCRQHMSGTRRYTSGHHRYTRGTGRPTQCTRRHTKGSRAGTKGPCRWSKEPARHTKGTRRSSTFQCRVVVAQKQDAFSEGNVKTQLWKVELRRLPAFVRSTMAGSFLTNSAVTPFDVRAGRSRRGAFLSPLCRKVKSSGRQRRTDGIGPKEGERLVPLNHEVVPGCSQLKSGASRLRGTGRSPSLRAFALFVPFLSHSSFNHTRKTALPSIRPWLHLSRQVGTDGA